MVYNFNGKNIKIPDEDIQHDMKKYGLTKDEAIQLWLEDEDYLKNEEAEELNQKAKENRITATIHEATAKAPKKTQRERTRKENPTKEMIIKELSEFIQKLPISAENVQVLNIGKLISFTIGDDTFEIDLKQKRKPKKG